MRLIRDNCEATVRNEIVLVFTLVEWHVLIQITLPDINPNFNLLDAETPRRVNDDVILGRALPSLTVSLLDIVNQQLLISGILDHLSIFRWESGSQFLAGIVRVTHDHGTRDASK